MYLNERLNIFIQGMPSLLESPKQEAEFGAKRLSDVWKIAGADLGPSANYIGVGRQC